MSPNPSAKTERLTAPPAPVAPPFPLWRCHKIVGAVKIAKLEPVDLDADGLDTKVRAAMAGWQIATTTEPGFPPVALSLAFIERHKPEAGGYLVEYEDGYKSYSPDQAFERGYTRLEPDYIPASSPCPPTPTT